MRHYYWSVPGSIGHGGRDIQTADYYYYYCYYFPQNYQAEAETEAEAEGDLSLPAV